jgi:hypothetical protein
VTARIVVQGLVVLVSIGVATPAYALQRSDTTVIPLTAPRYPGVATLQSEVRFGAAAPTAPEYRFRQIESLLPLPDGTIVVADAGAPPATTGAARVYDSTGRYLRTLDAPALVPGGIIAPATRPLPLSRGHELRSRRTWSS